MESQPKVELRSFWYTIGTLTLLSLAIAARDVQHWTPNAAHATLATNASHATE